MVVKMTDYFVALSILTIFFAKCRGELIPNTRAVTIKIPSQFIAIGPKYYFVGGNEKITWNEAHQKCIEMHAALAVCESREERAAISKALYHRENYGKTYWLSRNGREDSMCPYCNMGVGWNYDNKVCNLAAYWICETRNPMNVAQRVWQDAL